MEIPTDIFCRYCVKSKYIFFICFQVCQLTDILVCRLCPGRPIHTIRNPYAVRRSHSGVRWIIPEMQSYFSCFHRTLKLKLHPFIRHIMAPGNPSLAGRACAIVYFSIIDSADRIVSIRLHIGSRRNWVCTIFYCNIILSIHFHSIRHTHNRHHRLFSAPCRYSSLYGKASYLSYLIRCNRFPGYRKLFFLARIINCRYCFWQLRNASHSSNQMHRTDSDIIHHNHAEFCRCLRAFYSTAYLIKSCLSEALFVKRIPCHRLFFFFSAAIDSRNCFRQFRRLSLFHINRFRVFIA